MSIRKVTLAVGVFLAASLTLFGQSGAAYVFQLPGQNTTNGQLIGYPYAASPLAASINTLGPNGTYQIVPKPDGTGYYVLGATLQIANPAFTTFSTINGIGNTPTAVAASPDGTLVVVGAGDVYVISASTNQILLDTTTGGTVVGIAISRDSKFAYVLSNAPYGSLVTQINLTTRTKNQTPLQLTGGATSISFSPLGLLYVGAVNRVFEIDPIALQVTPQGTLTPNATPGPLRFTPDGSTIYFLNQTSNITGGSIVQITLSTYGIASWPNANGTAPVPLDDILIAGNGRVFAISYSTTTLYDVVTSPLSLSLSSLSNVLNTQAVLGAAVSNELPSALYLYLLVATGGQNSIYRITLSNNQISTQVGATVPNGPLAFVAVPPQTGAGSFLQYNNNQTVAQGKTSLPLIARVLDLTGRPIFNLPVNFTTDPTNGIVIATPSPTTTADGFVQTIVTVPAVQGTYTITLTAGTANITYTINVPGAGGTSGTGTGGVTQVSIVSGNGQLVPQGFSTTNGCQGDPLTVLVTDVNGAPLPGVAVNFSVTSGTGNLATYYNCNNLNIPIGVTDANGLAYTNFVGQVPAGGYDFETDTIVASTPYGSVSFNEIEYAFNTQVLQSPQYAPTIVLQTPTVDTSRTVTVTQGGSAQNAVTALILANSVPQLNCPNFISGYGCPIPGVSIRIVDPNNSPAQSPFASCQGSTLSDQTGTAHCTVVATCGHGLGTFPVGFIIGDAVYFSGNVVVRQGVGQNLAIVSGNNQTGPAGGTLQYPVVAKITDACGAPVTGGQVSFKVTSGSATLSNIIGTSGSSGQVSAKVTFGPAPGPVNITVTLGTAAIATFTLSNQAVVSSMTILNGNNQTATVSSQFAQSLTVQIKDASNNPVVGVSVAFGVTTGNASINPSSAVTDSQGRASTIATASQSAGPIVITASYASVSATFNLTAVPQGPQVTAGNFQNAASFQTGLVPCGLATATGSGLAPGIVGTVSGASFFGPLPYTLNGLSLSVNGIPAPIYQLSNTNGKQQVTFQTPCEVAPGTATVVIQLSGGTSTVTGVSVLQAQPGIFYYTGANGKAYGQVISADDGSYVTASNPAKRGHNYYLVATGLGQVTPATATNSAGINGQNVLNQVVVGVSNFGVPVISAVYQPGEIGVYVVGFTIPLTNPAGADQPLALAIVVNGQTLFGNAVYLPSVQ